MPTVLRPPRRRWSISIAIDAQRPLTAAERQLAESVFGSAIDYCRVTLKRVRWWPLQGRNVCVAPDGHLWFHPQSPLWCHDYGRARLGLRGLFIHEMTHVWQAQTRGRWYLPLMRHPFCRYDYELTPGKPFERYGIEQQAEIARHAFLLRQGISVAGAADLRVYEGLLPFKGDPVTPA